jgi:hypothetical protein
MLGAGPGLQLSRYKSHTLSHIIRTNEKAHIPLVPAWWLDQSLTMNTVQTPGLRLLRDYGTHTSAMRAILAMRQSTVDLIIYLQ